MGLGDRRRFGTGKRKEPKVLYLSLNCGDWGTVASESLKTRKNRTTRVPCSETVRPQTLQRGDEDQTTQRAHFWPPWKQRANLRFAPSCPKRFGVDGPLRVRGLILATFCGFNLQPGRTHCQLVVLCNRSLLEAYSNGRPQKAHPPMASSLNGAAQRM